MNLLSIEEKKKKNPYKVRSLANSTKDADMESRVVSGLFNSFFYIDSDMDMLIPGCAKRSISQRGPGTKAGNKIKHLKDHDWSQVAARVDVIDERKVSFNGQTLEGIYHESYYPDTTDSNDLLIKVCEGLYDSRSIGFRYVSLQLASPDSENEDHVANWEKYFPMALNPEVAEKAQHFWVIKEIELYEGSDVAFGANQLTPMLGTKSDSASILDQLGEKLSIIESLESKGRLSDDGFHRLTMEKKQLRQLLTIAQKEDSSVKDTLRKDRQLDTLKKEQEQAKLRKEKATKFYLSL